MLCVCIQTLSSFVSVICVAWGASVYVQAIVVGLMVDNFIDEGTNTVILYQLLDMYAFYNASIW